MKAQKSLKIYFQNRWFREPSKLWDSEKRTESETDNLSEYETLQSTPPDLKTTALILPHTRHHNPPLIINRW